MTDTAFSKIGVNGWASYIHDWSMHKGWWEQERNFGEMVALMHSELSEALEEWRKGLPVDLVYEEEGKPEGIPVELVDCIIRILDVLGAYQVDVEVVLAQKMRYNEQRLYRHGGLRA